MINFSPNEYQFPTSVRHNGKIILFATASVDDPYNKEYADPEEGQQKNIYQGDICFRVLDTKPEIPEDEDNWSALQKLHFPDELRPVSMNLVQVASDKVGRNHDVPFQVISDGKYIYVFQESDVHTLLVTRFLLVNAVDEETNAVVPQLHSPWEVRFQRSQKRDVPAGPKDSMGYKNMEEEPFLEPTFELNGVGHIYNGKFTVVLLPTNIPNQERWQIFVTDSENNQLISHSIPRSDNGLFIMHSSDNAKTTDVYYTHSQVELQDGFGQPANLLTAPAALLYHQQELGQDSYGREKMIKSGTRVMLAMNTEGQWDGDRSLAFDGVDDYVVVDQLRAVKTDTPFSMSAWVKMDDYGPDKTFRFIEIQDQEQQIGLYLGLEKGKFQAGFYKKNEEGTIEHAVVEKEVLVEQQHNWLHIAAYFKKDEIRLYVDGEKVEKTFGIDKEKLNAHVLFGAASSQSTPTPTTHYFKGKLFGVYFLEKYNFNNRRKLEAASSLEIQPDEKKVIAYWPFDDAEGPVLRDQSGNAQDGKISGAVWSVEPSSAIQGLTVLDFGLHKNGELASPVAPIRLSPTNDVILHEDAHQLTYYGCFMKKHKTAEQPCLVEGADGRLRLYFKGGDDLFSVTQFDTTVKRAIYQMAFISDSPDAGAMLEFVALQPGNWMDNALIESTSSSSGEDYLALDIKANGKRETWLNVPRESVGCMAVLSGLATDHYSDDGAIRDGSKRFYAYRSERAVFELTAETGKVWCVNRFTEGALLLTDDYKKEAKIEQASSSAAHLKLTLTVGVNEPDGIRFYMEEWDRLPSDVATFIAILNGVEKAYNYDYAANARKYHYIGSGKKNLLPAESEQLVGGSTLFTLVGLHAEGTLAPQKGVLHTSAWVNSQSADASELDAGSRLFSVRPKDLPDDGYTYLLPNAKAEMVEAGTLGTWTAPLPSYALAFDGTNYVQMDPKKVEGLDEDFTLETWIYPQGIDARQSSILQLQEPGKEPVLMALTEYVLSTGTDRYPQFQLALAKGNFGVKTSGQFIPQDEWSHLAASLQYGNAVVMEGKEHLDCGANDNFNPEDELTLEAWVRIRGNSGKRYPILSKLEETEDGLVGYELYIDTDNFAKLRIHCTWVDKYSREDKSSFLEVRSKKPVAFWDGGWQYLSATAQIIWGGVENDYYQLSFSFAQRRLQDNSSKLYYQSYKHVFDPTMEGFIGMYIMDSLKFSKSNTPLLIGKKRQEEEDGQQFEGLVDEARIWKRTLSKDEMEDNATNFSITNNQADLTAQWTFKEGTGDIAYDAIGSSNAVIVSTDTNKNQEDFWISSELSTRWLLYINGAIVEYENITELEPDDAMVSGLSDQFTLGGSFVSDSSGASTLFNGFKGQMDEFRIWGQLRTEEQISDNRFRRLLSGEEGLIGYWAMDDHTNKAIAEDSAINEQSNDGQLLPESNPPQWVLATSPVGDDAPQVKNVLGINETGLEEEIKQTPAVAEYGDLQLDTEGLMIGVMKRFYAFKDSADKRVKLVTGFKVGDLNVQFVGQVQTAPTLTGFIEGAPPVPSENLTVKSEGYAAASSVVLQEAKDTMYLYSTARDAGKMESHEYKVGALYHADLKLGTSIGALGTAVTVATTAASLTGKVAYQSKVEESTGQSETVGFQEGTSKTITNQLSLTGSWEQPDEEGHYLNAETGKRYLPANVGYALVKSRTADVYALRMKNSGALVAYQMALNPDIPEDWNIIMFPINPHYVKNGSLDGKVGFENDPDYPEADQERGSYFKPLEAYALKMQIEQEVQDMKAYYEQYDTVVNEEDDDPAVAAEWKEKSARRNLVNTYVWTASGGLYAEEEQFMFLKRESIGGTFNTVSQKGVYSSFEGVVLGKGAFYEHSYLKGSYLNITSIKGKEEGQAFGLEVNLEVEGNLHQWNEEKQAYGDELTPGKVDAYRFFSFYLSPKKDYYDTFFDEVVDDNWLANSDDPNARALRAAKSAENGVWRVMHRVTYVSRVPEQFKALPNEEGESSTSVQVALNRVAHQDLIELIDLRLAAQGIALPNLKEVADSIDYLLHTPSATGETPAISDRLDWWDTYWNGELEASDQKKLRQNLLTYFKQYYELG